MYSQPEPSPAESDPPTVLSSNASPHLFRECRPSQLHHSIHRAWENFNTVRSKCSHYTANEIVHKTPFAAKDAFNTLESYQYLSAKYIFARSTVHMKDSHAIAQTSGPVNWAKRFFSALLSSNPLLAILGIAFSSLGVVFSETTAIYVGVLSLAIVVIFTAWKSRPPKRLSVERLADQEDPISLRDLQHLDTPVIKLGLLGDTQSGKSTFRQIALQVQPRAQKTIRIDAIITPLRTSRPSFAALIDGDGTLYDQQLQICDHAEFILLFVDHNVGDHNSVVSQTRLEQHDTFLKQVQYRIGNIRPRRLHFILNKRDLWEGAEGEDKLKTWFYSHVEAWTNSRMAEEITSSLHSNRSSEDINHVLTEIQR